MQVEFYRHNLNEKDVKNVNEVLRSLFLTTGSVTGRLEEKFSEYVDLKRTVAVSSCTAALHLTLAALGIGPGDEVITTPMTFVATVTSIYHAGASPVFVDVEASTGLIDPALIENAITSRTKAIIPVHLYGTMADMSAIRRLADKHDLFVIEDCAHSLESQRDGIRPGQLGDAACYSFYATKNLTCGEGGAVCTNRVGLAERIRCLRTHGLSTDASIRYARAYRHWDMAMVGWKYNLDDIHAALLVDQLDRIDAQWKQRQSLWTDYVDQLGQVREIRLPAIRGKSGLHLFTIWVDPDHRDRYLSFLQQNRIGVAVNYRAVHTLDYFRQAHGYEPADFPVANRIGRMTLSLPFYPKLRSEEVNYVCRIVKRMTETR